MPTVRIEPDKLTIQVAAGDTLLSAVERAGIVLETPCGGRGGCGKCAVRIVAGEVPPSKECRTVFDAKKLAAGWRLACQTRVTADLAVEVPAASRIQGERIVAAGAAEAHALDPAVFRLELAVREPSISDQASDLDRLHDAAGEKLADFVPEPEFLRELPKALRSEGGRVAVTAERWMTSAGGRLLAVSPASRAWPILGASFDLGTTTVVGELWDLVSGRRLGVGSRTNPQRELGDDVISRAEYAARSSEALKHIQKLAAGALSDILAECLKAAGAQRRDVHEVVIAGNTVMTHLVFGVSAENIAQSPFVPVFTRMRRLPAEELGLAVAPGATVAAMPAVSGYVGGDIVAGMLATGLPESAAGPVLFIDIGTNGELVLVDGSGGMTACATAAGPAFEGARISRGMRAMSGAIEEVCFDGRDLLCLTIDGTPARGVCGTGLIDAGAALAAAGLMDSSGRLLEAGEIGESVPAAVRARLRPAEDNPEVLLAEGVALTQRDLRELQLAKAAVRAGAETLLAEAKLSAADVARVILAGAFGSYIDPASALAIGLLPEVPVSRVVFGGNTSAAGARLALLDRAARRKAEELARRIRYLELSGRPDFQDRFAEAMFFK